MNQLAQRIVDACPEARRVTSSTSGKACCPPGGAAAGRQAATASSARHHPMVPLPAEGDTQQPTLPWTPQRRSSALGSPGTWNVPSRQGDAELQHTSLHALFTPLGLSVATRGRVWPCFPCGDGGWTWHLESVPESGVGQRRQEIE